MSDLDDIKASINEAFLDDQNSAFRPAELYAVDANSNATTSPAPISCRAFIGTFSSRERNDYGIPDTDVKILVLQTNDAGAQVTVTKGDTITLRGDWSVIRILAQDPAQATWTVQGRPQ